MLHKGLLACIPPVSPNLHPICTLTSGGLYSPFYFHEFTYFDIIHMSLGGQLDVLKPRH